MDKKERSRLAAARWRARHPERAKETSRLAHARERALGMKPTEEQRARKAMKHIQRTYGLTTEQYAEMLAHGCGICGSTNNPHVDHDHVTGKVRGILCAKHNNGLGQFDDNPDMLRRAIEWLERPR